MGMVKCGDEYPMGGEHSAHLARIVAVDLHGLGWADLGPGVPAPTLTVACSCGRLFATDLVEAVAA